VQFLGVAAAAAILVVIVYPRAEPEPLIALSSVKWEPKVVLLAPITKAPTFPDKPRAAIIVAFKGLKQPWPQEKIDELYDAMKPTSRMKQRFTFVRPSEVKEAMEKEPAPTSRKELPAKLFRDLDISRVLFLTLSRQDGTIALDTELVDSSSGRSLEKGERIKVAEDNLLAKVREIVPAMWGKEALNR